MNPFDLTGKIAVITGSSRGIGRAIAEALAAQGAKVVISAARPRPARRSPPRSTPNMATAPPSLSPPASPPRRRCKTSSTRRAASSARSTSLVCNAASNPYFGPMGGMSDDQFRKILENNVIANHWLIQMVAPEMSERRQGSIIIISSIGGFTASPRARRLQRLQGRRFPARPQHGRRARPSGIRVNCIAPGLVRTDFARALWENPDTLKRLESSAPLRRIGEPEDIAGVAVFLASPAAAFVTGQTVVADGGATIGLGL